MKTQGYTYTLVMLSGAGPFVYCRYYEEESRAIEEACKLKLQDDDIDYILLRKGDTDAKDPIIWDSRKTPAKKDIKDFAIQAAIWKLSKAQTDFIREMIDAGATNKMMLDVLCSGNRSMTMGSIKIMRFKP